MLQLLGDLAWGSFLYSYMEKEKPRPKWLVPKELRLFSFFLNQHLACTIASFLRDGHGGFFEDGEG
ncbi:hypothetical protein J31TS6_50210 [Brevibacillus reuszeri]|nr:hypothetical protein J31TS6_50210 [Brevibacillus reuszeri]